MTPRQSYAQIVKAKIQDPRNRKSMREVGRNIDYSYEHVRKVMAGQVTFTREFNNALCSELGLNAEEMWQLAQNEKLRAKYGNLPAQLPKDVRVEQIWGAMNNVQKEAWIAMGEALLRATEHEREQWQQRLATLAQTTR
jgi:hypothetical protein